ncbi:Os06g0129650, partial [Oryza sativa Japonica Group]
NGRVAVGSPEPAAGDDPVRRLRRVRAVPAHGARRVGARGGAPHAAPRHVLPVVLAAPRAAARRDAAPEPQPRRGLHHLRHDGVVVGVHDPHRRRRRRRRRR